MANLLGSPLHVRRFLETSEKMSYINAVKCLQSQLASTAFAGARSRFDGLQGTHINGTDFMHFVVGIPFHPSLSICSL